MLSVAAGGEVEKMKSVFAVLLLSLLLLRPANAGTALFQYDDFGPQVAVHEFLGFGWFQWENSGDENPETDRGVKVVVYWDEKLEDVKRQYPVDQEKLQDFRYVEIGKATWHLQNLIGEFKSMKLKTDRLEKTLRELSEITDR